MARLNHFQTSAAIARMEPFKSHTGSMRGEKGSPSSHGRLPSEYVEKLAGHKVDYTVMSYATPIAWHHEGGWEYPDVSYSSSTSKHQAAVRSGLNIKNAREKKMEERAARKKAKADSKEQSLWNQ